MKNSITRSELQCPLILYSTHENQRKRAPDEVKEEQTKEGCCADSLHAVFVCQSHLNKTG